MAANKYLYILKTVKKEGYGQPEMDKLFSALVMPKLVYGAFIKLWIIDTGTYLDSVLFFRSFSKTRVHLFPSLHFKLVRKLAWISDDYFELFLLPQ